MIYKVKQNKITGSYYICRWSRNVEIRKTPTKEALEFMAQATRTEEPLFTVWARSWEDVKQEVFRDGPKR